MERVISRNPRYQPSANSAPETLAELFCYLPTRRLRVELEAFRREHEREHGQDDICRPYTSRLPTVTQLWLLEHHPDRYFAGLPAFVQAFVRIKMQQSQQEGTIQSMPDAYVRLFLTGEMDRGPGRG